MLEGMVWIGGGDGGDGGDGGMGGGDWKDFPHARASGARRICCGLSGRGRCFYQEGLTFDMDWDTFSVNRVMETRTGI